MSLIDYYMATHCEMADDGTQRLRSDEYSRLQIASMAAAERAELEAKLASVNRYVKAFSGAPARQLEPHLLAVFVVRRGIEAAVGCGQKRDHVEASLKRAGICLVECPECRGQSAIPDEPHCDDCFDGQILADEEGYRLI